MDNQQIKIFKNMTAEQKINLSLALRQDAVDLKISAMKSQYPELSRSDLLKKVRKVFLYARS